MISVNVDQKTIDTRSIKNKLIQGESLADTIALSLPLTYGDLDLSLLSYEMRGTNDDYEATATQVLTKTVTADSVLLEWSVASTFTSVPGELKLILVGSDSGGETIIKCDGDSVYVRRDSSISGFESSSPDAYERLLAQVNYAIDHANTLVPNVTTDTDTTINGIVKGASGKIAQAVPGTDYEPPIDREVVLTSESTDEQIPSAKCVYNAIKNAIKVYDVKRYGVRFTGSASAGDRLFDAVGLTAGVGIGSGSAENDFDGILPWSGMKRCNTTLLDGERVPTYFEGEFGYSNTDADVYVRVPLFFYYRSADDSEHVVSMTWLDGYRVPEKFKRSNGTLRDYVFLPAYTAGVLDGVPVSRSGYYPHLLSLNAWMALASTKHTAETLDSDIWIEGTKDDEIKNILLNVEFAARDPQTVMMGACSLRYSSDVATAGGTNQFTLAAAAAAYYVVGQAIAIGTTDNTSNVADNATITAVNTATGLINFAPISGDVTVSAGNYIRSRPWKSGACDGVTASSGSPVSNTSGVYPCKYRGVENPWGNQFRWRWDYLQNEHAPSILLDPAKYAAGSISGDYHALSYSVPTSDGYATEMGYDENYPFVRVTKSIGGSNVTYFADYYSQNTGVRALLVGGYVIGGRDAGSRYFRVSIFPSVSNWAFGAALCPA